MMRYTFFYKPFVSRLCHLFFHQIITNLFLFIYILIVPKFKNSFLLIEALKIEGKDINLGSYFRQDTYETRRPVGS